MIELRHVDGGLITGRFTDHHVHLQLVDHTRLTGSRLGRVIDLGANPDWARTAHADDVAIEYAGAFLTAPGGYPSDREWAPAGSVQQIPDAASAAAAVTALAASGARFIKATLHSEAGPVFDDVTFRAIVETARAHMLPVVAHAEGAGQAQRAASLGATLLAHAPFSERLTNEEIAEQAAAISWISTLAIHDEAHREIAIDNVRRFAASGGAVLYGTDMGNGDSPVDLNVAELAALREAGIDGIHLLKALAPMDADPTPLFLPDGDPALARPLTTDDQEA